MSGTTTDPATPTHVLARAEEAWAMRYARPELIAAFVADGPEAPQRRIAEAFLAWRGARLEVALETVQPLLDAATLDARWSARARNVTSVVLQELGRAEDALESQLLEMRDARDCGDPVAQLTVVHDLAVTYEMTDPPRALAQLREAWETAVALLDAPEPVGTQVRMIAALALANLHFQTAELAQLTGADGARPGEDAAEGVPGLDAAVRLADTAWPELAAALRAAQSLALLEAGDVVGARLRAEPLPDPARMRDVTNAAMVVRALAALARHDGDLDAALRLLVAVEARMSTRFRIDVLTDIAELHERRGELREALAAVRRQVELTRTYHLDESRMAVRALEVQMRTETAERAAAEARRVTDDLLQRVAELRAVRDELADQVLVDPLTGLGTRAVLHRTAARLDPSGGHEVAVVDVDLFKQVNDRAGHAAGDDALRAVADALRATTREGDVVLRLGGDEIVVVRPGRQGNDRTLAGDLRAAVRLPAPDAVREAGIDELRLSIGVATATALGLEDAMHRADLAMYGAKRAGGGTVVDAG